VSNTVVDPNAEVTTAKSFLSEPGYRVVKFIAMILLPAIGTFYFTLAGVWHFGYAEQVVGSIVSFDTLLGVLLGVSTANFNASNVKAVGDMVVNLTGGDAPLVSLRLLDKTPEELAKLSSVVFNVVNSPSTTSTDTTTDGPQVLPPSDAEGATASQV